MNKSIRVITQRTPRHMNNNPDEQSENIDEHAATIDEMLNNINTQLTARRDSLTGRSGGSTSFVASSVMSTERRFSAVDNFRYSKELLCKMNIKELGILLSCLMPIVQVDQYRYMIGAAIKELVVKRE
mmetsp:Transcript_28835/g.38463  ORF Transcript_28835/g.38463 Transcript_28835/m.38463 type:complete len:128 (+) Transcript_28835:1592-1975(+)|eukprot:CAMPEP_0185596884 /NCGR_PEP_ID=MMETSP0434-20130131/81013_1 /TAXON_ID=626734 ORGANISM="Favella taraikaensis, Strain Fe Narragansett Bay" /NCGR_SAMPLE_ID=MMETSP0434 /ASSEMBLY_ACC=CAM_ASM_000379 /LENGTH=127 /DNA_ID=CAMNT_0028225455 /DNA_START=1954 /DNA_END=2337 /DNA_ORIENTATION=-